MSPIRQNIIFFLLVWIAFIVTLLAVSYFGVVQ